MSTSLYRTQGVASTSSLTYQFHHLLPICNTIIPRPRLHQLSHRYLLPATALGRSIVFAIVLPPPLTTADPRPPTPEPHHFHPAPVQSLPLSPPDPLLLLTTSQRRRIASRVFISNAHPTHSCAFALISARTSRAMWSDTTPPSVK